MPKLRTQREQSILLSLWGALLGEITSNMRAVFVDWDNDSLSVYFIFDGAFTEEEKESVECIGSQISSDFFDDEFNLQCLRLDYPEQIKCQGKCVYMRKESLLSNE